MGEWISEQPNYTLIITYPDDLLEESVVYQDIFQKGYEQGLQQAGAKRFMVRVLERKYGKLSRRCGRSFCSLRRRKWMR